MTTATTTHLSTTDPAQAAEWRALERGQGTYVIDSCVYESPERTAFQLADGRCAIKTTNRLGFSTVTIYPDRKTYDRAWHGLMYDTTDPETGRKMNQPDFYAGRRCRVCNRVVPCVCSQNKVA